MVEIPVDEEHSNMTYWPARTVAINDKRSLGMYALIYTFIE